MNSQLSVTPTTKRPLLRLETVLILIGVVALTLADALLEKTGGRSGTWTREEA